MPKIEPAAAPFTLGQPIMFRSRLRRLHDYTSKPRAFWQSFDLREPRAGAFFGWRTLANGTVDLGNYEGPTEFKAVEHFTAFLIAFDVRQKPVYVMPDDVWAVA